MPVTEICFGLKPKFQGRHYVGDAQYSSGNVDNGSKRSSPTSERSLARAAIENFSLREISRVRAFGTRGLRDFLHSSVFSGVWPSLVLCPQRKYGQKSRIVGLQNILGDDEGSVTRDLTDIV